MAFRARRSAGMAGAVLATVARSIRAKSSGSDAAASPSAPAVEIDFSLDPDANHEAALLASRLQELSDLAEFAGLRIVGDGIELNLVGPPTPEVETIVAREATMYGGRPIPVRYRSVSRSLRELEALTKRIGTDLGYWQGLGVELSTWGPNLATNTVDIALAHSTQAYAHALITRYGDAVTVSPRDTIVHFVSPQ